MKVDGTLKFSHEYGKLGNDIFPTIRRATMRKAEYYVPGKRFRVLVFPDTDEQKDLGVAQLVHVEYISTYNLHPAFVLYDTDHGKYPLDRAMTAFLLWFVWVARLEYAE